MKYIYNIIGNYKKPLLLIYIYIFITQIIFLVEPYVLGKSIDGLLKKDYNWIGVLLFIELLSNFFVYKRMVFDTKIYTSIYNDIVFNYLDSSEDSDASTKLGRTDLAHNIVDFLEHHIHYYIMSVLTIVGTLFFIFMSHVVTGFIVLICVPFIVFIVWKFYGKIAQSTRVSHNQHEEKMNVLNTNDRGLIDSFFKRRRRIWISASTLQGKNWTALYTVKTIFLVLALIIFTNDNVKLTQGEAIAMYSYINQFLGSLLSIPVGMEMFTRMGDVIGRLKTPVNNEETN
jgi:ABC-type multidrug transport system fused ATPase/permease subunit